MFKRVNGKKEVSSWLFCDNDNIWCVFCDDSSDTCTSCDNFYDSTGGCIGVD